jgi:DNA repair exonuclease SbcCD nuclease subunit
MALHGEVEGHGNYGPISRETIARSGLDYLALGHVHRHSQLQKDGNTFWAYPGCPEGRGFDETGEKTVNIITLSKEKCELETRCIAGRRYESIRLDVTGLDPLLAIHTSLPDETMRDIYRITLVGEAEGNHDINRLYNNLDEMFFELQIRDDTRIYRGVWDYAGEDSLRGLFLKKLKAEFDSVKDDKQRNTIEQAARWGLAALDNMEEVVRHDNK